MGVTKGIRLIFQAICILDAWINETVQVGYLKGKRSLMRQNKIFTYHSSLITYFYSLFSLWLHHLLLVLFWGTGILVAFRFRHFTAGAASITAFVLLALVVAGTMLLLAVLGNGRSRTLFAVVPGIFVTVFLVLPSCHFTGISVYLLGFLPTVLFLWHKNHHLNQPSIAAVENFPTAESDVESEDDLEALETAAASEWDENVQMRLLRRKEPDETDLLEAWVRADFLHGERAAHIHVPFCPPFREQPKWDACQFEGDEVEIQLSQLNPLGTRIDLKRPVQRKKQESVGIYLAIKIPGPAGF